MASVRRIYIDRRVHSSGVDSDFTYDLPRSIEVPDQTFAYVDSVCLPNVLTTLHDRSTKRYVTETVGGAAGPVTYFRTLFLG